MMKTLSMVIMRTFSKFKNNENIASGQTFLKKIRTFSEQNHTVLTFLGKNLYNPYKKSVQFWGEKSEQTEHLRKIKPFLRKHTSNPIFLLQFFI